MPDISTPSPNISEIPDLAERLAERLTAMAAEDLQAPDEDVVPDGYISDAELMAWLQAKSTSQYDSLRELMNVSNERGELIQKLNNLKADIDEGKAVDEVTGTMEALLVEYEKTPYDAELRELLGGVITELRGVDPLLIEMLGESILTESMKNLSSRIQGEMDKLGKVDQLALVQIQQLMADARETAQLASNVLGSREQTRNSIIGNIRG